MSILVRFAPASMTTEQYEAVKEGVSHGADFPPDGMELHVCFGSEGALRVSEIWASRKQFEAFAQRLMPELQKAGLQREEPEILEIHSMAGPAVGQAAASA
jgi:hypothetical protein